MICSPEKLAANRANGAKSTGPKTEAGKDISRRNAIKHGFTGAGMALPDEDAAAIEASFDRHYAEMKPKTQAGAALVFTVALNTLRMTRFGLAESAMTSQRILDAGDNFDDAQIVRRDEAKARLYQDPPAQLAVLSRFEVGVRWLLDAWDSLGCALESGQQRNWKQPQFALFEALTGRSPEFRSYHDSTFWNLAVLGDEGALSDPDLPGDTPASRCQSARERMLAVVEEEIARWQAHLETATASTALARANAIQAARYDGSKEGLLAKKYEAATNRELKKALKDFKVVEAEFSEPEPAAETAESVPTCDELGSFFPEPEQDATGSIPTFPDPSSDRVEANLAPVVASETAENCRS